MEPKNKEQRDIEPRDMEPKDMGPRDMEPRVMEPRVMEQRNMELDSNYFLGENKNLLLWYSLLYSVQNFQKDSASYRNRAKYSKNEAILRSVVTSDGNSA